MSTDDDGIRPTRDDRVRDFLLDPISTPVLILCSVMVVNLVLVCALGGPDGMRAAILRHAVAWEEQKRKDDMQLRFSRPGWRPDRPGADDDDYAK